MYWLQTGPATPVCHNNGSSRQRHYWLHGLPCLPTLGRHRPGTLAILVQELAPQQATWVIRDPPQPLFRSLLLLAVKWSGFRGCSGSGRGILPGGHFRRLPLIGRLLRFIILRVPGSC